MTPDIPGKDPKRVVTEPEVIEVGMGSTLSDFVDIICTYTTVTMTGNGVQDLPVVLDNEKRGLLTVEEGRLDVLQLSREGRREYSFVWT